MIERSLNEMSNAEPKKFDSAIRAFSRHRETLAQCIDAAMLCTRKALPQACALCAARCGDAILCDACMNALPRLPVACPICAAPQATGNVCGSCLKRPPKFARTIAAAAYAFPLDRLVQGLKYQHRLELAQPLADALAAAVLRAPQSYARPEAIIALPLAPTRQRERGFNQAIEIARVVARRTHVPMLRGLERTSAGRPQASLPWSERRRNVRGAFVCTAPLDGLHVAIVDDVMTTGATLDAAAGALQKAGAAQVDAWVVARTLPSAGL